MSLADDLNDSDLETLRKLLKQSGRAAIERRKALCIEIGIDSGEISGIGWLSENDFAVELIDLLVNRELEGAVFKLCETLKRDFDGGIISSQLGAIVAKLKQPNSQPDYELGKPPSSQGEDYPNLSLNNNSTWEFFVKWKKHLLASGTIILIGLAGFQIYKYKQSSEQPAIPAATTNQPIDYSRLEKLLADQNWKEADKETTTIMLKISQGDKENPLGQLGYLDCKNLDNIDRLWMKSSNGRFGFSVQNGIYEMMDRNLDSFYDSVGWVVKGQPRNYDSLTFTFFQKAPRGHLPTASGGIYVFNGENFIIREERGFDGYYNFFSRFGDDCKPAKTANQPATVPPSQLINETQIPKVDYSQLKKLLTKKEWKAADEETRNIIVNTLKVSSPEQEGGVLYGNGQNFSCLTLKTIDQLWLNSTSKRHFGYSVQKLIWQKPRRMDMDRSSTNRKARRLKAFDKEIGWMDGKPFIFWENAPRGHLPTPIGKSREMWLQYLFECRDL